MSRVLEDVEEMAGETARRDIPSTSQRMTNTDARESKATRSIPWAGGCGVCCPVLPSLTVLTAF